MTTDNPTPEDDDAVAQVVARIHEHRGGEQLAMFADPTETLVREAHAAAQQALQARRDERDAINDDIRRLVDEETVLARAVAVFDRFNEAHADDDEPEQEELTPLDTGI